MSVRKGSNRGDTLSGNLGSDVLLGLAGDDRLAGGGGEDRLDGGAGNDLLLGGAGDDVLIGGAGDDTLSGDAGRDTLRGDAGNDTYVLDAVDEIVTARADAGTDTVKSSVSYTLGIHQEHLTLTGSGALDASGNGGANVLIGNAGANRLDGRGGADSLRGGAGNDVLVYDSADLVQSGGTGNDTLVFLGAGLALTTASLSRASAIEVLDLRGAGANSLSLDASRVASLSDTDVLRIRAGTDDEVTVHGAWVAGADTVIGGVNYAQYTLGGATLQVESTAPQLIGGVMSLANLAGTRGFRLDGVAAGNGSGYAVGAAGDVNGDGFDDLIVGAPSVEQDGIMSAGASYVVFGRADGFAPVISLGALDGSNGFRFTGGGAAEQNGTAVSGAGDVNGDGIDDLLIGAPGVPDAGTTYVLFGQRDDFAASISFSDLQGNRGFRLLGRLGESAGSAVSGAGDFNGDGIDDFLIGAYAYDTELSGQSGASYLVFGRRDGFAASIDLTTLDGSDGFRLIGTPHASSGRAVSGAGDVNGDGFDDLLIGAYGAGTAGRGYVVFGNAAGFAADFALDALDGANGFRLDGVAPFTGFAASGAGDVNGDGFADVLISAYRAAPNGNTYAGSSYVIFGHASGFAASLSLNDLDGSNGFRLDGVAALDASGRALSDAGDVNGDGYDDLIIGARDADPGGKGGAGSSYVVFGRASGFGAHLSLADLDGTQGFRLDGASAGDSSGRTVSAAGDVDGDGYDDVLVGAPGADANGSLTGSSYVIFGRDFTGTVARQGGVGNDSLTGTAAAENLVGGRGDDLIDGAGGADVLRGGTGDDTLVWREGIRDLDGGSGLDTLRVEGGGVTLDLDLIADNRLTGIERIDLTGSGDNSLNLSLRDLLALPDGTGRFRDTTTHELLVDGDSGDSVVSSGQGWVTAADVTINGTVYAAYTHADVAVTLFVDLAITPTIS